PAALVATALSSDAISLTSASDCHRVGSTYGSMIVWMPSSAATSQIASWSSPTRWTCVVGAVRPFLGSPSRSSSAKLRSANGSTCANPNDASFPSVPSKSWARASRTVYSWADRSDIDQLLLGGGPYPARKWPGRTRGSPNSLSSLTTFGRTMWLPQGADGRATCRPRWQPETPQPQRMGQRAAGM